MAQSIITAAFETYKAQQEAALQPVELDEFVLANVPNQDPDTPIDPDEGLPPAEQIVYVAPTSQSGYVNPSSVVYSLAMDTRVGNFKFNWIGLRNKASGVLAAISHISPIQKTKSIAGVQNGNAVTRSILMSYQDAQALTGITVDASTWQIDFTARLFGIDENERLVNMDVFGKSAFLDDGFLVVRSVNTYTAQSGRGYVGGLRCHLDSDTVLTGVVANRSIYLDASWQGHLTSKWDTVFEIKVSASELSDYVDEDGYQHYVTKIADIDAAGNVTDRRYIEGFGQYYQRHLVDELLDDKVSKTGNEEVSGIKTFLNHLVAKARLWVHGGNNQELALGGTCTDPHHVIEANAGGGNFVIRAGNRVTPSPDFDIIATESGRPWTINIANDSDDGYMSFQVASKVAKVNDVLNLVSVLTLNPDSATFGYPVHSPAPTQASHLTRKDWVENNFVDKKNAQDIEGAKKFKDSKLQLSGHWYNDVYPETDRNYIHLYPHEGHDSPINTEFRSWSGSVFQKSIAVLGEGNVVELSNPRAIHPQELNFNAYVRKDWLDNNFFSKFGGTVTGTVVIHGDNTNLLALKKKTDSGYAGWSIKDASGASRYLFNMAAGIDGSFSIQGRGQDGQYTATALSISNATNKVSFPATPPSCGKNPEHDDDLTRKAWVNNNFLRSVPSSSTTQKGIVQLTNSATSNSTTTAATPAAVKTVYDLVAIHTRSFNYVGSYVLARYNPVGVVVGGAIVSGGHLTPSNGLGNVYGGTLSGSWRCMGHVTGDSSGDRRTTLWVRVA